MPDVIINATATTRAVQYGPRVLRDGNNVEPPAPGEQPEFYGVYVAGNHGGWVWQADAHDEESARVIAGLLRTAEDVGSAQRLRADALTLAYVAMGAQDVLRDPNPEVRMDPDDWDGELGFIDRVIDEAVFVDRVGDYFDEHPGVFAYEVAQEFGEAFARALLLEKLWEGEPNVVDPPSAEPARILRDVMVGAGYEAGEVDAAIAAADRRARA